MTSDKNILLFGTDKSLTLIGTQAFFAGLEQRKFGYADQYREEPLFVANYTTTDQLHASFPAFVTKGSEESTTVIGTRLPSFTDSEVTELAERLVAQMKTHKPEAVDAELMVSFSKAFKGIGVLCYSEDCFVILCRDGGGIFKVTKVLTAQPERESPHDVYSWEWVIFSAIYDISLAEWEIKYILPEKGNTNSIRFRTHPAQRFLDLIEASNNMLGDYSTSFNTLADIQWD